MRSHILKATNTRAIVETTMLSAAPSIVILGTLHFALGNANSNDASIVELIGVTASHHSSREFRELRAIFESELVNRLHLP